MISKALNAKSGIVLIAALATSAIGALPAVAGPERLAHVLVSEVTQPPPGWVDFCARQPGADDCEDCALLKRRMLIEAGWPREALLLTPRAGRRWRRSCGADGDNRQGRLCP
jgi:predicted transglutaminase-like cysteine proteinase